MKHRTGAGTLRWLLCLTLMLGLMLALGTTAYAANKKISVGTTWNIGDSFNLTTSGQTVIIDDRNDHWIINNETTNTTLTTPVYQNGRWEFTNFLTANPHTTNLSGLCLGTGTTNGTEEVSGIVCISGNGSLNYPYKFALIAGPSETYSVIVIPGNHMTRVSGDEQQSGLVNAMQPVIYKADDDYFFENGYGSSGTNGIKVSRYDNGSGISRNIRVHGTPTANTVITLKDPSPKTPLTTPSAVFTPTGAHSGTLTNIKPSSGVSGAALYYRVGESGDWTKIGSNAESITISGISNGDIIQVYEPVNFISTVDHLDSAIQSIIVSIPDGPCTVTVVPGEHLIKTEDSGAAVQTVEYSAIADVIYTPEDGYYFPTTYSVEAVNGITVKRTSYTKITVSGMPTADAVIALPAPAAKEKLPTPEAVFTPTGPDSGTLTNVTTAMYYRVGESGEWTKITGTSMSLTGLSNGDIIQVYQKITARQRNTNYDSDIQSITVTMSGTSTSVTITAGSNMTKTTESGDESQTGLSGAMADVVYTANEGYYFPENYSVAEVNGISVTRDSATQITVSGTPTADAEITLTAPTAKTKPDAPTTAAAVNCTTADSNDGKLTGVTTAMEYKKSDADNWTDGTGNDITGLAPGTYYVRYKATDTALASDNQELTIKILQTITAEDVTANYGETGKSIVATTDGDGALSYAVKSGDAVTVDSSTGALTIAKVGTAVITVTAAETQTYAQTTKDINVTVGKANPTANAPTGLTATYGQTLADVSLEGKNPEGNTPGTWAWAYAETTSVGDVGTNTFKANFTPTDTANYNSVENVDVTVKVKLGEPRIAGYDLVLDGVLGLRCYVEVPEGFDGTDAAMTFSMPYREDQVIPYGSAETDAEGRKVFTCNVYAYQMADEISVSFAYQKDGETKYVTDAYSVKEYLDKVEADTSSEETLALVNATRNYGHYVQPYLHRLGTGEYQTEMPAGTGTPDIDAAKTGSAGQAVEPTVAYLDSSYFSGAIIRLNVNTGTDLVFELKPVAGFEDTLSATVDDTSYDVMLNDRGVYRIAKQTIAANNLEVGSSFTVKYDEDNVFTITASPMNYISLVLGQSTADDERYALAALYEYWAAADGYNHSGT